MNLRLFHAGLFVCTGFGFALRLYKLSEKPVWIDEMMLWMEALGAQGYTTDAVLSKQLLFWAMRLFGASDFAIARFIPALCGSVAIFFVGLIARELAPKSSSRNADCLGWMAAALFAVLPVAVLYSREARPYGTFFLALACLYWSYLKLDQNWGRKQLLGFGVCVIFATTSHYLALWPLVALSACQSVTLLIHKRYRQLCAFLIVVCAACVPTLLTLQLGPAPKVLSLKPALSVVDYFVLACRTFSPEFPRYETSSLPLDFLLPALALAGGAALFCYQRSYAVLLSLVFVVSLVGTYVFLGEAGTWGLGIGRYLSHLAIPLCCLCAYLLHWVARIHKVAMGMAAVVLVVMIYPKYGLNLNTVPNYPQVAHDLGRYPLQGVVATTVPVLHIIGMYQSRPDTPLYYLRSAHHRRVAQVRQVAGAGGVGKLWVANEPEVRLEPGLYAIVHRSDDRLPHLCAKLNGTVYAMSQNSYGLCSVGKFQ